MTDVYKYLNSVAGLEWLDSPQGTPFPLDAVSGNEAAALYALFFRNYVQRKRQELLVPKFIDISEIVMPKFSLVHWDPKVIGEAGPSASEAFIGNYPGDVFIDFVPKLTPVLGKGRVVVFDVRKAIQSYRASHYMYSWTKNIGTIYNKPMVLIVKSYGLANRSFVQRPNMFVNFEKHYNHFNMLMDGVNEEAERGDRKQFLRMDLPINMPHYQDLLIDYQKYVKTFKNGLPVITNPAIRTTKAENSYWVLDLLGFLLGDYEHSLFNKLTDKAKENLHLIFQSNGKVLIINVGILKGWLDELNAKPLELKEGEVPPPYEVTPRRLNVTKRVYLALLRLTQRSVVEEEPVAEVVTDVAERTEEANQVASGKESVKETPEVRSTTGAKGTIPGPSETVGTPANPTSILDVFNSKQENNDLLPEGEGTAGTDTTDKDAGDWAGEVDDKLLQVEQVSTEIVTRKEAFPTPESGVLLALNERAKSGNLSIAEKEFFIKKSQNYKTILMGNGQTLEKFMEIDKADLDDLGGYIDGDFPTVLDKSMLRSRAMSLKNGYAKKFLQKDMARMFLAQQNGGTVLVDYKHEVISGIEGVYDVFHAQLHDVNGSQGSYHVRVPRVEEDGTFTVDGVKQHLELQRMELPVRKIDADKVILTSYYDRKLSIVRSRAVVDNLGLWMVKQIRIKATAKEGYVPNLTFSLGNSYNKNLMSPRGYSLLAKKFKTILVKDFGELNFQIDELLAKYPQYGNYVKKDAFLIGVKDGQPLWVDDYGNIYQGDTEINTLESVLGIDMSNAPIEHCVINISGYLFPIGVVLCYYFGIDELLRIIKATTRSIPMGTRPKLEADEFAIRFSDEYLVFNRREKLPSLIFGGMIKLNNISNFARTDLNNRGIWVPLMGDPKVKVQQFKEMKNLFDFFIDPITKEELKRLKYSTSFNYLLIDAVKLLETDFTRHEVEIEEQRIVGYERFAGHAYRAMVIAQRQFRNKGTERKHTIDLNPEAVIMGILTDTSVNLVEEVNPGHQLKDQEEVTFGGTGGRNIITVVKRARQQLESYKGVISEAHKDSDKVGFVTYLTSDPRISDFRGHIDVGGKDTITGIGSVTANLAYGVGHDDAKRNSFLSTQMSQAVSAVNYTPNILRTGYDNVMAHRTSKLYSMVASDAGKVVEVTDSFINVRYDNGDVDIYPLGLKIGSAAGELHRHTRVTDLKPGDKFKKGDVIGWDEAWFQRDTFCPGQVVWKAGRMVRIALVEDQDVYEDSMALDKELAAEFVTPYIKPKRFAIDVKQNLIMHVKVGDSVDYDSILCDVEDPHLVDDPSGSMLVSDVNRLGVKQVRSTHHGKVISIEVVYNSPMEDMSDSVRKFITAQDKIRKKIADIERSPITKGAVSTSLNVNKPILSPGRAFITICIEAMDGSTRADKYVLGNQLKGTIGRIMQRPMMTQDGRRVLVKSSMKGMFNRMVLSFRNKLISCELVLKVTQTAIDIYRGRI